MFSPIWFQFLGKSDQFLGGLPSLNLLVLIVLGTINEVEYRVSYQRKWNLMENLPETLCVDSTAPPPPPLSADATTSDVVSGEASSSESEPSATVDELLQMLHNPDLREEAMELLNKVHISRFTSS